MIGYSWVLDVKSLSRKARGYLGGGLLFIFVAAAYSGEAGWLSTLSPGTLSTPNGIDWTQSGFGGFFVLYMMFQIINGVYPMYSSW